jgi:hypothetical protein
MQKGNIERQIQLYIMGMSFMVLLLPLERLGLVSGYMAYIQSIEEPTIGMIKWGARGHQPFTR